MVQNRLFEPYVPRNPQLVAIVCIFKIVTGTAGESTDSHLVPCSVFEPLLGCFQTVVVVVQRRGRNAIALMNT